MTNLTKKIVAIITTVTCAVWMMGPGVADALTAAELQTMIDSLLAQIATLQSQLSQVSTGGTVTSCSITSFTRNLSVGSSGNDVKCLQIILNSDAATQVAASGVGSSGYETTTFGPLTKAAVIKFQVKYASEVLTPLGLTAGTGFVGAKSIAKLNTMIGATTPITPIPPITPITPISTTATVSLSADTPEAKQTALGAVDAISAKIKFTGGTADYTVSKIIIKRGGVAADADVSAIKLYDGLTQVGSSQALNTNTHKATFSSLNWTIPAGTTKYLTVKVSVAAKGTATVGDSIKLGIESVSDITSTATLSGAFPIYGTALTIAGISVGELFVDAQTTPAEATILSGATEQEIAAWKFTASDTEAVEIHSIKITHVGSAATADMSNLKLKISGVQIGSTIPSLAADNTATFDLTSAPISMLASGSKTVYAYADIAGGIWTSRTVIFEITQYSDVTAYGTNSGGAIEPAFTDIAAFAKQTGQTMTIGQGSLTVAIDAAYNPAVQSYVKGTTNRLFTALKFTAGSREGVRVVKLKLNLAGTNAAATDVANVTLWDGSTQIAGPASVIGSYVTFGSNTIGYDSSGLFDVAKSANKTITVKADVPSGANSAHTVSLSIAAYTDIWIDGLESRYDIDQTTTNISLSSGTGNAHTIAAVGTMAVSKSATTPSAQTYIKGATAKEFLRMNLQAGSGEDVSVTSLTLDLYKDTTDPTDAGDLTNIKLLKSDGTQLGSTIAAPTTEAAFSFSLNVPASETLTLKVMADIPTGTTATSGGMFVKLLDATHMDSEGAASAATITETGFAVTGNVMAIGEGTLTISAAATPGDQTVIIGATEVPIVGLVFTAGSAEDVRITKIKLSSSGATGTEACAACHADQDNLSNIALYDGATRLTVKRGWDSATATTVDFTASDFLNGSGIDIAKGGQKTITVKADFPATGTSGAKIALGIASSSDVAAAGSTATTTDVVFTGLASNASPAALLSMSAIDGVNYDRKNAAAVNIATLAANGTLTLAASADTPDTAIVTVGANGVGRADVVFLKVDFTANREDIDVKSLNVVRKFIGVDADADFANVSLWDGTTQIGTDQTLVNAGDANSSSTFSLPSSAYWRIPAGTTKTLTVKADLNGVKTADQVGVTSGDALDICLSSSTNAIGVSSGVTVYANAATICSNPLVLYRSKPTIAAASLPDSYLKADTMTLYRWTVTADSKGDIGWAKVVFDISGSITYHDVSCTIGKGYGNPGSTATDTSDRIVIGTSTEQAISFITGLKVYVVGGDEITASTTNDGLATLGTWNYAAGGARVAFLPAVEQVVAAGTTKTYELKGDLAVGPASGDAISVKIANRTTATTTGLFATLAAVGGDFVFGASSTATFVWTDRSGVGATHAFWTTADWSADYKVSGLQTASLSLSR